MEIPDKPTDPDPSKLIPDSTQVEASLSDISLSEQPELLTTEVLASPPSTASADPSLSPSSSPDYVEFVAPSVPAVKSHLYLEKIAELRASEASYIIGLENLKNLYFPSLLNSSDLPPDTKKRLKLLKLSNIISFHKLILKDLYNNEIVDTFVKYSEYLSTYENYIVYYSEISNTLRALKKSSPSFSKITTLSGGLMDLFSYLIMPVQRLPRYELILRDVQKLVQKEEEIADIQLALRNVKKVTEYINQAKRKYEQLSKVQFITQALKADEGIKIPRIFHQSQKLIKEFVAKCYLKARNQSFIHRISSMMSNKTNKTKPNKNKGSVSRQSSCEPISFLSGSMSVDDNCSRLAEFINSLSKRKYRFFIFSDILLWTKPGTYKVKGYINFKYGNNIAGVYDGFLSEEQLSVIKLQSRAKRLSGPFSTFSRNSLNSQNSLKSEKTEDKMEIEDKGKDTNQYSKHGKPIFIVSVYPPVFNNDRVCTEEFVCLYFDEEEKKKEFLEVMERGLGEIEKLTEKGLKKQIDIVEKPKFETTRKNGNEFEYRGINEIEEEIHATKRW